jgi:hypothetical protein
VDTGVITFLILFAPIGVGMGTFQSPNNSAIMGSAPFNRLGIVSGLLAFTRTVGQTTGIALLGSLWASRTVYYSDGPLTGGATEATPAEQALALHDTFLVVTILITIALLLAVWALVKYRRQSSVAEDGTRKSVI